MKTYLISFFGFITFIVFFSSWRSIDEKNNPIEESSCLECHTDLTKLKHKHDPATDDCDNCHFKISRVVHPEGQGREFKLTESIPSLCFVCHDNIQSEVQSKYPHAATEDCTNCHNPHSSNNRGLITEKVPDLCFTCHYPFVQKHSHVPVQDGECLTCHTVHGSNNRKLLTERDPADLCLMCHDLELVESKVLHAPVEGNECLECHDAHDSNNRGLLKQKKTSLCISCHTDMEANLLMINTHAPFDEDCGNCHSHHKSNESKLLIEKGNDLCFICHDDIQEKIKHQSIVHNVVKEIGSCIKCHSPHASNESSMLVSKEKDLCLACHNKEYTSEFGTIKNIEEHLNKNKYVHKPVREACSTCHDPHAEKYPFLLIDYATPMMYSPANTRNFQLCFNCHDKNLMTLKNGNLATNFRNGRQNLHFVHLTGNKARNCNICHDVHAADNEHLIRDKIWFGQWEMPIEYESNLNGGSCLTGCHEKKEYFILPSAE